MNPASVVAEPTLSGVMPSAALAAAMAYDSVQVLSLMLGYEVLSVIPAFAGMTGFD